MEFYTSLSVSFLTCLVSVIVSIITSKGPLKGKKISNSIIWLVILLMMFGMIYSNVMLYRTVKPINADNCEYIEIKNEDYLYTIKIPDFMIADENNYEREQRFSYGNVDLVVKAKIYEENIPYEFTRDYIFDNFDGAILLDYNELEHEGWYVLSVKTNDRCHYRKCMVNEKKNSVRMFTFSVPVGQIEMYSSVIDKIEESFRTLR